MIYWDQLINDLEGLDVNLYRLALYTPGEGVRAHQFRPCSRCCNCYSVAKVFVVTAIGFLQEDGLLRAEDPIAKYLGDQFPADCDPRWYEATIEHAMTHRLGFDKGFLDIDVEDVNAYPTDDYLQMVLSRPLAYAPGTVEVYSDAAFYLLSRLISRVAGETMDRLLQRRLLKPLGFGETAWSRCPLEHPIGATGLYARAEDVVKLAAAYMQGGRYEGRQIIPEAWVKQVLERGYELRRKPGVAFFGKGGMYGQYMLLAPEKQIAIAWHSFNLHHGNEQIFSVLAKHI